jgi:hypothetical protein
MTCGADVPLGGGVEVAGGLTIVVGAGADAPAGDGEATAATGDEAWSGVSLGVVTGVGD